jgi:hypothetical protein
MHIHTAHGIESRNAAFGGQGVHFRHDEKRNSQNNYYTMITIVCDGPKNFAIPLKGGFVTTAVV